jgi:hypothetical protein
MNPADVLSPTTEAPERRREESPATHLAKLRQFRKWDAEIGKPSHTTDAYEEATNRLWRNRYIRAYNEAQKEEARRQLEELRAANQSRFNGLRHR